MNNKTYKHYANGFKPVSNENSKVLFLGAHPSEDSLSVGFYYSGSRNRFWLTMAKIFGVTEPRNNFDKESFCLDHGIALWDVLKSCDRKGASDASIRNAVTNDLEKILLNSNITHVFCLGKIAYKYYMKYRDSKNRTIPEAYLLVSSSFSARSTKKDAELVDHYKEYLKKVPGFEYL